MSNSSNVFKDLNNEMLRYGVEKMYSDMKDKLTERNFKIGRDGFVKFCHHQNL